MPSVAIKQDTCKSGMDMPESFKNLQNYLEKKIRNLEKKKNRLDDYQRRRDSGEKLTDQQEEALSSANVTVGGLELAKEFLQQVLDQAKYAKKVEKKQKIEKDKQELDTIKRLLGVQSMLDELGSDTTKHLFTEKNPTVSISLNEQQLQVLDDLYQAITPRREEQSDEEVVTWDIRLQQCAENCISLLESRDRQINSHSSYRQASDLIEELARLPYFTASFIPKLSPNADDNKFDPNDFESEEKKQTSEVGLPPQNQVLEAAHDDCVNLTPSPPPPDTQSHEQAQQQCSLNDLRVQLRGQFDFVLDSEIDEAAQNTKQGIWNAPNQSSAPCNEWTDEGVKSNTAEQGSANMSWEKKPSWQAPGQQQNAAKGEILPPIGADSKFATSTADVFSSATQSDYLKSEEIMPDEIMQPDHNRGDRGGALRSRAGGFRGRGNRNRPPRGIGGSDFRSQGNSYRDNFRNHRGGDENYSGRASRGASSYSRSRGSPTNT